MRHALRLSDPRASIKRLRNEVELTLVRLPSKHYHPYYQLRVQIELLELLSRQQADGLSSLVEFEKQQTSASRKNTELCHTLVGAKICRLSPDATSKGGNKLPSSIVVFKGIHTSLNPSNGFRGRSGAPLRGPVLGLMCMLLSLGCGKEGHHRIAVQETETPRIEKTKQLFVDVTESLGLNFRHHDGESDTYEFPRSMGSGCGFLDANGDGRLDLLLVDGGEKVSPENSGVLGALYLQGTDGGFHDFSEEAGLVGTGYGMGAAVGDVDNDGDIDIYLTKYGPDQLFLNDGTGRFADGSATAGIINPQWSTAAAFVDLNNDGWLDIVVANYVDYFPGTLCTDGASRQDFCGPQDFRGTPNRIFMNLGTQDGTRVRFEDRSGASGIANVPGKSLGLACRDFDQDGDVDIFVANDGEPNHLWIQTEGQFTEEAVHRGVAVNRFGEPEANMGTLIEDLTGDGLADLLVTHLSGEMNTLWKGDADGLFMDQTSQYRMGAAGLAQTGFGVAATDVDNNGDTEILIANGKVKRDRHRLAGSSAFLEAYAERNQIFEKENDNWREIFDGAKGFTGPAEISRGLATGDFDQDGDQDLLVSNVGGIARLYRNDAVRHGHWLTVIPLDAETKRVAYNAKVTVVAEPRRWVREIIPHTSYLSSHEPTAHFGLGEISTLEYVEVTWPGAAPGPERFPVPALDRRIEVTRGQGKRQTSASADKVL